MKSTFGYSRSEYNNMLPYERDIETELIIQDIQEKLKEQKNE